MKKILKWSGIILLLLIAGFFITVLSRQNLQFDAPYPNIKSTEDSGVIEKGKKLVFGAAHCANCHTSPASNALVANGEETALAGGMVFDLPIGKIYSPNLTPDKTGIGHKTDEALARALRFGVGTDGRALFDFMPFHNTSDEDLTAIISYLRSRPAVENKTSKNNMNLLGKIAKAFLIKPVGPSGPVRVNVQKDTTIEYGAYLATSVANCRGCHTNRDLMTGAFTGKDFAGGLTMEEKTDSGKYSITTPNLTPHTSGRINGWSQQQFIARFRQGRMIKQSHMPWEPFSKMSDNELKAIYKFLQTVKPVDNKVTPGLIKVK